MIKQSNLAKSSFTLLETLLSISLLSLIISGFINSTYNDEQNTKNYQLLNTLENKFDTNEYKNFPKNAKNLTIIINDNQYNSINVKQYEYQDENIKLVKYEK